MNIAEVLKSQENSAFGQKESEQVSGFVTQAEVEAIYEERKNNLELIRSAICLKLYHDIAEKLKDEKLQFERLLNWHDTKKQILDHYSFVLDSHYFEQKFLAIDA